MKIVTALALALTVVGASSAAASSITINTDASTTYTTGGVVDFSTYSTQMNGMEVTAYWTVNGGAQTHQTEVWNGGLNFSNIFFNLVVTADTFDTNAWNLDFNVQGEGRLQALVFNGVPGHTVFDRTTFPGKGTPGSDWGKDLDGFDGYHDCWGILCFSPGEITATYFNPVVVGANPFGNDIYAGLRVDFLSDGGLNEGSNWKFTLDTDIATTNIVNQTADVAAVPEPGSMVLLGTGLLGVVAAARRRARRS